jgi:hypothetical protein
MPFCPYCGKEVDVQAEYCYNCGQSLSKNTKPIQFPSAVNEPIPTPKKEELTKSHANRDFQIIAVCVIVVVIALIGLLIAGLYYPGNNLRGSGNLISRDYNYTGFTNVQVGSGFSVNITHGSTYLVNVTTDDNIMDHVSIGVSGGTLHVGFPPGISIINPHQLRVDIVMPSVTTVDLSGGSSGRVYPFGNAMSQGVLNIVLSGGSSLTLDDATVASFSISLSAGSSLTGDLTCVGAGGSSIQLSAGSSTTLAGEANDITIDGSAGSSANLRDMSCHNVVITLSDGSSVTIDLNGRLDVDLSGGSSVLYFGSPTLGTITLTGYSTVSHG